ncbi:aldehyde ferredoxin oxidoreductase family protein [Paramaledivibacter caminithermalis]|uniref:Aldehyde:ferredoxin oxidoreductase n=1 Tax=Paramaledivibacter caminithermalis (strain DSM 15212 / CIP 107654 / DViRD3) TaxID=1121301 RepID=A0A1M6SPG3_PARC5|nr:aldehyde ferredoxin oxidoreductase C-terminal domain-containing protein [Paramaledivibacter caminithermalis]SHK46612.1 aldehyde:ferredoxin oxidoreductase [Paramaledivibacter caminithermalis DSM 15212]
MKGNCGKLLRIDLSSSNFSIEDISISLYRQYIGGMGLATYYLNKEMTGKENPLDKENKIIIAVGPLTGTIAPTSSRFGIFTKSPLTNGYLESYCGGDFGKEVKKCGFDVIIIEGKSKESTLIEINNDSVKFDHNKNLIGLKSSEIKEYFKSNYTGWSNLYVGPAGERNSKISGVFSEGRCAGRGGAGAVFGSKSLKGIVIKGDKRVDVYNKEEFMKDVNETLRELRSSKAVSHLKDVGTGNIIDIMNFFESLPNRNFQNKCSKEINNFLPQNLKKAWKKSVACFNCPIACSKIYEFEYEGMKIELDGPEYETIWSLGINLDIYDLKTVAKANYICDEYGIDTISTGNIIGFIMELYEKGMIDSKHIDGVVPEWGSSEALIALTKLIASGKGFGMEMNNGVKYLSSIFEGSKAFAMHVKGMELPAFHPSGNYGISLGYAISNRGGCHLHGAVLSELFGGADRKKHNNKVNMLLKNIGLINVINSSILCYFVSNGIGLKEISKMIKSCTGIDYKDPSEFEEIGLRINKLCMDFNKKCGYSKEYDKLPLRSFDLGTNKDILSNMIEEYHEFMMNVK